jgi:DNA-binding MarR family transcriptional regulator/ribosomal protein S18 acetylase RimI-like enzyme
MNETFAAQVADMRRFNRFYTRTAGFLNETLTRSDFTLAEARILFELAHGPSPFAVDIGRDLKLDPAYLARILKRFASIGLLVAEPDEDDRRRRRLVLTTKGKSVMADLWTKADADIGCVLSPLGEEERRRLTAAMAEIEKVLSPGGHGEQEIMIRPHRVGDMGWIIHRQAVLYAEEYGWDIGYEGLIAGICSDFLLNFKPGREYCWIAERNGAVVGSVFLVRKDEETAKLRLLYVEPSARGLGVGRRLVDECIRMARDCGYRKLVLWTNDVLAAARKIYRKAGFVLVEEERHRSFGKDLVGQNWELELQAPAVPRVASRGSGNQP